jgi:acetyl-CoA synthetase
MRVSQVADNYAALHASLRWQVPQQFNMAQVCCARWAQQPDADERIAIHAHRPGGVDTSYTFAQLHDAANRLSNVLAVLGVERGDRVAIVLPQRFETAVAYMAVLQMGAVAMPLSTLFGPEALEFRLHDSEARVAICDNASVHALLSVRANCPLLETVIGVGDARMHPEIDLDFDLALAQEPGHFRPVETLADDPAVLIYTSGTTGQPKGALIPHRALIGNLSGFVCSQNWFGFDGKANRAQRRHILVARGLGLDRAADGRLAAHAVLSAGPSSRATARFSPNWRFR